MFDKLFGGSKDGKDKPAKPSTFPIHFVFIGAGFLLLSLLCIAPTWVAALMLNDGNYTFWAGRVLPICIILLVSTVLITFLISSAIIFQHPWARTDHMVMRIANVSVTVMGLTLMMLSLPLSRQAIEIHADLMYRCEYSIKTHRLFEFSSVLHNIRSVPECLAEETVEDCVGYEDAYPYTDFLKAMESSFKCSGFCWRPLHEQPPLPPYAEAALPAVHQKVEIRHHQHHHRHHKDHVTRLALLDQDDDVDSGNSTSLLEEEAEDAPQKPGKSKSSDSKQWDKIKPDPYFPPTLFSKANYQASCDGMAARDVKNFAGDMSFYLFYQGIYLIFVGVMTGFIRLIGYCHHGKKHGHGPQAAGADREAP
eukprot:gnl/TRDRNA2_/TRDRNA2_38521_c0_seq1.p1 gnl/TRDRNA2_/TRDRNA2_38521_c0~~gnl/TRDRNA2_/TRDRNA2_38521_c0_seq1.p1  ORF type:complete len:365 (+),score=62.08 gnl/TRDRNA2_/TRDRNA2_38521_c0_seq1:73-1167(+)